MSGIYINHNALAANTANTLSDHYSDLAVSTKRLSSGLRINSAADDAAGLAIRELQRADIAALNQGVRNANDAISMIQTFDGALSVIDEKLIRMKELAEQAATGTYDSTQRLMIDSEFQAMGAEINRIARATDFNGIKLINGDFETPATEITGADGKTYDVTLTGNGTSVFPGASAAMVGGWDTSGITNPGALVGTNTITLTNNNIAKIGDNYLMVTPVNQNTNIPPGTTVSMRFDFQFQNPTTGVVYGDWYIGVNGATPTRATGDGGGFTWNSPDNSVWIQTTIVDANGNPTVITANENATWNAPAAIPSFSSTKGTVQSALNGDALTLTVDLGNNNTISQTWNLTYGANVTEPSTALSSVNLNLKVVDTTQKADDEGDKEIPDNVVKIHFGTMNDSAEDYYYINKHDATLKGLGLEGVAIKTQDAAQGALVSVDSAIVEKDKIRAEYGAMQNRLENTVTNLKIQSENLQNSESRISDTDIAQEMMSFVTNQILTQSAVAMLAQANNIPQMVMRLIAA